MDDVELRALLERCAGGSLSIDEVIRELRYLPYADLGFARVDHHRELRLGLPEAVYGPGKTPEHVAAIVAALLDVNTGAILVTRASAEQYRAVLDVAPEAELLSLASLIVARRALVPEGGPMLAVVSAGTADLPVAEEAACTAEALGLAVERLYDVGVAGLHRLLAGRAVLDRAAVVIVVAGMDGALASVVGGLVAAPVIAVPTSVGYGAGAGGIAPLLTMLNACAPGVVAVNIDNGFGAAVFATLVLRRAATDRAATDRATAERAAVGRAAATGGLR